MFTQEQREEMPNQGWSQGLTSSASGKGDNLSCYHWQSIDNVERP